MRKIITAVNLLILVVILVGCDMSDDRKLVHLAIKKDGKTYLFSNMGSFITQNSISKNESPPIMKTTQVIEEGGDIYVQTSDLEKIVNLISGNYELFSYQEKSYDGYVVEGDYEVYDKKYGTESTAKIGQMISKANVNISDTSQMKEYEISWHRSPNQKPVKNCEEMDLWVDKSYKPGTTTLAQQAYIVVNLSDIVNFYNSNVSIEYSEEDEILYVIVN